jgi:hypothetical protein
MPQVHLGCCVEPGDIVSRAPNLGPARTFSLANSFPRPFDSVLSKDNREDAHEIKRAITATRSEIGGEIRGLKIALESLSLAELGVKNQSVIEVLGGEHNTALETCLTTCKSAEEAVEALTSFRVGAVQHNQNARLAMAGTVGTVTTRSQGMRVDRITGGGNATQMVLQEVGADAVQGLFGGFWDSKPPSK